MFAANFIAIHSMVIDFMQNHNCESAGSARGKVTKVIRIHPLGTLVQMFVPLYREFDAAINMRAFSSNQLANELIDHFYRLQRERAQQNNYTESMDKIYFSFTRLKAAFIDFFWQIEQTVNTILTYYLVTLL